jgi:hypothetical protein
LDSKVTIMTKTRNLADLGGGFIQAGTGAVQRTVESKLQDVVSVKDFGAVGDGVADDTAAIQAALNSNARTIHLIGGQTYKVTSSITIPANKIVVGNGATITTASHFTVFTFSNGGGIYNTKFIGPGNASNVSGSTAIKCSGTNNDPAAPTYVTGPTVSDCTITGFGEYGVFLQYVRNAYINNNTISNVAYAGIGGVSCEEVIVESNKITNVTPGSAGGDAYGVFIDRFNGTSETAEPRSYRCVISKNIIDSVISSTSIVGHGIDTHGGIEFIIDGNQIKNCQGGIWLTASSISGAQALGPKRCVVTNNIITSTYFVNYGIIIYGARTDVTVNDYAEECVVSNNILTGHGSKTSDSIPGMLSSVTKNCKITDNVFKQNGGNSLMLDLSNINVDVSGNTFIDPQSMSYTAPACIRVSNINNSGLIGDNSYYFEDAALSTYVAVNSVRIESGLTGLDLDFTRSTFLGIDATHLQFTALTSVRNNGLMKLRGQSTISVGSGGADGITDVTFNKQFPYTPDVTFTLRQPYNQGGKFPIIGVDTSVPISKTGFRIYARPSDGTTWSATGTLTFDWMAS